MTNGESLQGAVTARSLALFGKRDASSDYDWLRGAEAIPASLYSACEQLARASNESGVVLALVAAAEGRTFLVRTFRQGVDNAYRPVLALEVAALLDGISLSPADWVGLASSALQPTSQESAGSSGLLSFEAQALAEADPPTEALDSFRLGVPVSVSPPVARGLLRRYPDRAPGIVLAPRLKNGVAVPWKPFAAPFLAINFGPPALQQEEEETLRALRQRPPSEAEWEQLERVEPARGRLALRWALEPEGAPPLLPELDGDPLLGWLACFRRQAVSGAALLRTLRHDLAGRPLPSILLERAFPELTAGGREAILAATRGDLHRVGSEALEEIARHGLLADAEIFPLDQWATATRSSDLLAQKALEILCQRGEREPAARLALGLSSPTPLPALDDLVRAAEIARSLLLTLPLDTFLDVLDQVTSPQDLATVMRIGEATGVDGRSLARIVERGLLPEERNVEADNLVHALQAKARMMAEPALLPILSELIRREWNEEARGVLAAAEDGRLPELGPLACGIVRVRLGEREPVPITDVAHLRPLVEARLARPEDVVPPSGSEALAAAAELWPQTAFLASVLRGEGPVPPETSTPSGWRSALREALTTGTALRWLTRLDRKALPAARSWIAETLGLPAALPKLFDGEAPSQSDAEELWRHLPWIETFSRAGDPEDLPELLVILIRAQIASDDDVLAEEIVLCLFPGAGEELRALAVHLLSGMGPMPLLSQISPEVLSRLVPVMPVLPLVDALFASPERALTRSPALTEAVYVHVKESAEACPMRRYTQAQIGRHAPLARRLAELSEWERVSPDRTVLLRLTRREVRRLGLSVSELWPESAVGSETEATCEGAGPEDQGGGNA